jgi:hypothetical protein
MTSTLRRQMENIGDNQKKIFWILASCLLIVIVCYVSFLLSAFLGGVERKELVKKVDIISAEVEQLETEYLSAQKKIDVAYAIDHGFVIATDAKFVSLIPTSANLSLNKF